MTTETRSAAPRTGRFDPATYEAKWQARWEADGIYAARDDDPGRSDTS
jgi:valyl-tRNA synthetase